jgi:predicted Zn-dependent protease
VEKAHQGIKRLCRNICKGLVSSLLLLAALLPLEAKAESIKLISDEETEQLLARIAKPLFEAAGVAFDRYNIMIVEDNSLNAFVSDGNLLFVHTGTIIRAQSVDELAGVIAHETGHIMGGHILRQKLENQNLQTVSLVSALLAGTTAVVSGRGDAAMAVMLGGQSSALNSYLHYRSNEERSADEAAVTLLKKTHQSPQGILNFMKKINQDNFLNGREESPYFRTHPVTSDRIAFFEQAVKASASKNASPLENDFERVKAKLKAYLLPKEQVLRNYPLSRKDVPAQYAHAVLDLKTLKFQAALTTLQTLLVQEPNNPYFYELQGQIFMETGQIAQAKNSFAEACRLLPEAPSQQINYAQALLEDNPNQSEARRAVTLLNKALLQKQYGFGWALLSKAYAAENNMAATYSAAAEYSCYIGNTQAAEQQLKQALAQNPSAQIKLKINDLEQRLKAKH